MKFICSIDIEAPRDKVVALFLDPEKQHYFQDGFISKTLLNGTKNTIGAKSKLTYKRLELIETILKNNLPDEFEGLYEHKHTTNTMNVKFETLTNNSTRYTSEIHYTEFKGLIVNIIAKISPGMFKKQVKKWMLQFKNYIETN